MNIKQRKETWRKKHTIEWPSHALNMFLRDCGVKKSCQIPGEYSRNNLLDP